MEGSDAYDSGLLNMDSPKQDERTEIPETLPVLPVQEAVAFPYTIVPLMVSNDKGIHAVDQALLQNRMIFLVTQRDQTSEDPTSKDLYDIGTVGVVIRMLKLPEQ